MWLRFFTVLVRHSVFMAPLASRGGPSTPTRVGLAGGAVVATAVAVLAVVVAGGVVVVVAVVVVEFVDRARPCGKYDIYLLGLFLPAPLLLA